MNSQESSVVAALPTLKSGQSRLSLGKTYPRAFTSFGEAHACLVPYSTWYSTLIAYLFSARELYDGSVLQPGISVVDSDCTYSAIYPYNHVEHCFNLTVFPKASTAALPTKDGAQKTR